MAEIVYNNCYGGYNWSKGAMDKILELKKKKGCLTEKYQDKDYLEWRMDHDEGLRTDPEALEVLKKYGSEFCSGHCACLRICEYDGDDWIPDVREYDGNEWVEYTANITEEKIRKCASIDEVVELLKRLGVIIEWESEKKEDDSQWKTNWM